MKINATQVIKKSGGAILLVVLAASCTRDPDSAGYEYMPDMYRSPAIETYVDYGMVGSTEVDSLKTKISALIPPAGTIPFGTDEATAQYNMPYPYENTTDGYETAGRELSNPLPYSKSNLDAGKHLYENNCIHCHGEKGKGDGKVVTIGGHAAPGAYDGPLKELPVGKIFHTLTYGKGMMGSHAYVLNKKERWQTTMYVQALQNGGDYPESAIMEVPSRDSSIMNLPDSVAIEATPTLAVQGIRFQFGSHKINKNSSRIALNKLLSYMNFYGDKAIRIEGHTDNVGSEAGNQTFSEKRANSVKKWLEKKGIDSGRILTKGYGQSRPIATNETEEGRAQNRRTEIRVLN